MAADDSVALANSSVDTDSIIKPEKIQGRPLSCRSHTSSVLTGAPCRLLMSCSAFLLSFHVEQVGL